MEILNDGGFPYLKAEQSSCLTLLQLKLIYSSDIKKFVISHEWFAFVVSENTSSPKIFDIYLQKCFYGNNISIKRLFYVNLELNILMHVRWKRGNHKKRIFKWFKEKIPALTFYFNCCFICEHFLFIQYSSSWTSKILRK